MNAPAHAKAGNRCAREDPGKTGGNNRPARLTE